MEHKVDAPGSGLDNATNDLDDTNMPNDASPLLALAGELRNNIYEYAVQEDVVHLRQEGTLVFTSSLARASSQIGSEYLPILKTQYTSITTIVLPNYQSFNNVTNHIECCKTAW